MPWSPPVTNPGNFFGYKITVPQSAVEFHKKVVRNISKYNGPLGTVVDIGAHWGFFSLYACFAGAERVYAIEPASHNYGRLVAHIYANELQDRIVALNCAVTSSDSLTAEIQYGGGNEGMRGFYYKSDDGKESVALVKLRNIVDLAGDIDYLKVDTEGSEHEIFLANDIENILSKVSHIEVETHVTDGSTCLIDSPMADIESILRRNGFSIEIDGYSSTIIGSR